MPRSNRHRRVPNANSPQLLTRLLETVARGIRSSRGIQESLGVDVRTVQYYSQAADWLGFMDSAPSYQLTPIGLEYVYAGRARARVYARAVWATPFVSDLMKSRQTSPTAEDIANFILEVDDDISASTARRRASSVRSLIGPALQVGRVLEDGVAQLALPLPKGVPGSLPELDLRDEHEFNPDVYRLVWGTLIDCGELRLQQLRAVLDSRGAADVGIGGALELAVGRGDAFRMEDRLVVTPASLGRRELLETTTSIMLSDPGYRGYLNDSVEAIGDRPAAVRRDQQIGRFRYWDKRLFGHPVRPEQLAQDLELVLLDRPLNSFPLASPEEWEPEPVDAPFLDSWDQEGMAICLPSYLRQLQGGVERVNRALRAARMSTEQVEPPGLASCPKVYHGGLIHPGEPLPRSVPDTRSLRLRAVMHTPYVALATALLLLHRYRPEVLELCQSGSGWEIQYAQEPIGELLEVLDAFCVDVGMVVCRGRNNGISGKELLEILCSLEIATSIGPLSILSESFFAQLREDAEEIEVHLLLQPLMEALDEWLSSVEPPLFLDQS